MINKFRMLWHVIIQKVDNLSNRLCDFFKDMSKRNFITKSKFTLRTVDTDVNHFKDKLNSVNNDRRTKCDKDSEIRRNKFNGCDSDEEFAAVLLPKIEFCDSTDNLSTEKDKICAQISDLCDSDREKIAHLIGEIVRYKDIYNKRNEDYQEILCENLKKNEKIIQLEQDLSAFKLGCQAKDNDIKFLTDAHKIQETALKKQILDFQRTIMSLTKEKLNLEIEIQKLKKQNEHLIKINASVDKEKQNLRKKCILMKDRLKMLHLVGDAESKLKNVYRSVIDEKCIQVEKENNEHCYESDSKPKLSFSLLETDQEILGNKHEKLVDDDLISELFFLPSQQTFPDFQLFSSLPFKR